MLTEREQKCLDRCTDEFRRTDRRLYRALRDLRRPQPRWPVLVLLYAVGAMIVTMAGVLAGVAALPVVVWLTMAGIGWVAVCLANR